MARQAKKYDLVLIVYGHVGCDRKFNSKTCRKTIVNFNENTYYDCIRVDFMYVGVA